MAIDTKIYWLHILTPLHVGAGRGVGFIDMPVMREKVTGWPLVPGSAFKGVMREHFVQNGTDEKLINAAFGKGGDDTGNAGSLVLTDAHIVCMPVRSLYGTFAYVTCPLVLERLERDLKSAGYQDIPNKPELESDTVVYISGSKLASDGKVFLEDLDFSARINDDKTKEWAEMIAGFLFSKEQSWKGIFKERFAILSDDSFNFLAETGTEVLAHVRIDESKKIVAPGALWYEESLPAETILAGISWCDKVYKGNGFDKEAILGTFCPDSGLNLQIGGKATVGKGQARCLFTRAKHERKD